MSPATVQHLPMVGLVPTTTPHKTAEKSGTTEHNSVVDLSTAIPLALARAGLSHKQACAHMGIDTGNWSKALHGDGHVSLQRLLLLPVAFWCEFLPMLAEPAGLAVSHEDIADIALKQAAVAFDALARSVAQLRAQRRSA
jgi:hypothetical protein